MVAKLNPFRAGWENSKFYFKNLSALTPVYCSSFLLFLPSSYLLVMENVIAPIIGLVLYVAAIAYIMFHLYQYDHKGSNYRSRNILSLNKGSFHYICRTIPYFTGVFILSLIYALLLGLIAYMLMFLLFDVEALATKFQETTAFVEKTMSTNPDLAMQTLAQSLFTPAVYFVLTAAITILALLQLFCARLSFYPFKWLDTDFNPTILQSFKFCRGYSWRAVVASSVSYIITFIPATLILTILYLPILIFAYLLTGASNFDDAGNTVSPIFDAMASSMLQTPYLYAFLQYYKLMKKNAQAD